MKQIILGTAGHIDHGKTSLIKAISGIDTDRLKEEKQRGITIELGFAALDLPDGQHVGITICDHPTNINHPSPWYAIRSKVMSYYSPAVICYGPLELQPDESFELRYRVIIHTGQWDSKRIEKEYERSVTE